MKVQVGDIVKIIPDTRMELFHSSINSAQRSKDKSSNSRKASKAQVKTESGDGRGGVSSQLLILVYCEFSTKLHYLI